jgi:hypothetical protein
MATNNTLDGGYEALLKWYDQNIESQIITTTEQACSSG